MFHIHEQHLYRPDDTATDGYPGPVIWPMSDTPITTAQLEAMRTTLHKLHLLGSPVELGAATWVADVPDTFISIIETTATGTRTYTHQIGALDMDVPAGQLDISEAQIEARKAIAAWVQNPLQEIQSGHREIVEFTRYRITAQRQLRSELDAQFKDQEVKWNEKKWLLAKPLEGERVDCRDIEGDDVAAFADAVTGANAITYWASGSDLYQLAARGLLPGEPPCEASNAPTSVSP
jgi:hypothetical protein